MGKCGHYADLEIGVSVLESAVYNPSQRDKAHETRVRRTDEDDPKKSAYIDALIQRIKARREKSNG